MNVIKIVVDKVPKTCHDCHLQHQESYGDANSKQDEFYVCEVMEQIIDDRLFKPDWCPLVVEDGEVCEWKGVRYKPPGLPVYYAYYPPHDVSYRVSTYRGEEYLFCPDCGKRIKYVEVE